MPLLSDDQKSFLDMPHAERIKAFADADYRRQLRSFGYYPAKVRLEWECGEMAGGVKPVFSVVVSGSVSGSVSAGFGAVVSAGSVSLDGLFIYMYFFVIISY